MDINDSGDAPLLENLLGLLKAGKVRELDDITDLCTEAMSALVTRQMSASTARELRQWTELMFTCVQAQQNTGDGDGTYITQLIQMNSVEEKPEPKAIAEDAPVIDVLDIKAIAG